MLSSPAAVAGASGGGGDGGGGDGGGIGQVRSSVHGMPGIPTEPAANPCLGSKGRTAPIADGIWAAQIQSDEPTSPTVHPKGMPAQPQLVVVDATHAVWPTEKEGSNSIVWRCHAAEQSAQSVEQPQCWVIWMVRDDVHSQSDRRKKFGMPKEAPCPSWHICHAPGLSD